MDDKSQTLDRGLKVLEAIDAADAPIGVREIARQLELGTSIVQRLVNTLEAHGFVEQDLESRRYRIGHRSVVLGRSSRRGDTMTRVALAELQELAEHHGLNGYLGVLSGDQAVYVLAVPSRHRVVLRVDAGETMPFHSTALGKVLLAAAGEARARLLLGNGPLAPITPQTITDPELVVADLPQVRAQGYARADEENIRGIISVGAPVRNSHGKIIAGLSVAFTKGTTSLDEATVAEMVIEAASRISRAMGCPEDLLTAWETA